MQNRLWLKLAIYLEIGLGLILLKITSTQAANAQMSGSVPLKIAQISLQPFFDQINNPEFRRFPSGNPADITPLPPYLNAFDQAVLKTCGTIGVVYTFGVVIKQGNRTVSDRLKGYSLVSDAAEILIDATKAFKSQGNKEGACLYPVRDQNSGKSYQAVFVKDRKAIVTFYPDATPKGKVCAVK
ncbi:MAG: EndoU domain-containing protein [Crinalium sp.]